MIYDKILFSAVQPSRTDIAWAKPLKGGGFALYLFFNGKWQTHRQMNDMGTVSPDDDIMQEMSGDIGDITGVVEQEVARQIAEHDENVNDTHHTSSSSEEEYPDIDII